MLPTAFVGIMIRICLDQIRSGITMIVHYVNKVNYCHKKLEATR